MDCTSDAYTIILIQTFEEIKKRIESPWGNGRAWMDIQKYITRTSNGLVEQLRPFLSNQHIEWLETDLKSLKSVINEPWEGRGKHLIALKKIENILNYILLRLDNSTTVSGPCIRF
jgi:hypothetical protein